MQRINTHKTGGLYQCQLVFIQQCFARTKKVLQRRAACCGSVFPPSNRFRRAAHLLVRLYILYSKQIPAPVTRAFAHTHSPASQALPLAQHPAHPPVSCCNKRDLCTNTKRGDTTAVRCEPQQQQLLGCLGIPDETSTSIGLLNDVRRSRAVVVQFHITSKHHDGVFRL